MGAHALFGRRYRLGIEGYRLPVEQGFLDDKTWRGFRSAHWRPLSKVEVTTLIDVGALLARLTSPDDFLAHDESDLLRLALRTFNASAQREQWQDRTVDLAVALEALFARETSEVTHKAAMRAALLLGRTETEAIRFYEAVRGFYDFRSGVVHANLGKRKSGALKTIRAWRGSKDIPAKTEWRASGASSIGAEIVAAALRAFLRLEGADRKPFGDGFLAELDMTAFSSARRLALQQAAGVRLTSRLQS